MIDVWFGYFKIHSELITKATFEELGFLGHNRALERLGGVVLFHGSVHFLMRKDCYKASSHLFSFQSFFA